jgi:hypothetical protein
MKIPIISRFYCKRVNRRVVFIETKVVSNITYNLSNIEITYSYKCLFSNVYNRYGIIKMLFSLDTDGNMRVAQCSNVYSRL